MAFWTELLSRIARRQGSSGDTFPVSITGGVNEAEVTDDGELKVKTDMDVTIASVTVTDITIKDPDEADNKLKVNEDGSVNAQLVGAIPEYNWFAGEERPEPAEPAKPAIGVEVDAETGDMVGLLWNGEDWEEV